MVLTGDINAVLFCGLHEHIAENTPAAGVQQQCA
jgi:hypothetical protein